MRISEKILRIKKSAIHEMTRLSKEIEDVAFLSWAKPTSDTPEHIKEGAIDAIKSGLVGGYTTSAGLVEYNSWSNRRFMCSCFCYSRSRR
jgi:aspartate/methionine/tyrosine aminotransferase